MWIQNIFLLTVVTSVFARPVPISVYQQSNGEEQQEYQPQYRPQPIHYKQQPQPLARPQSRPIYKQQEQDPRLLQQTESQDYEMEPPQPYQFSFDVADDENTNYQNRKEQREGNKISGSYSVVDSDGFIRTVTYTADPVEGFKAHVSREPTNIVVKIPTPQPQLDSQGTIYTSGPKIQYSPTPATKQIGVQYNGAPVPRHQPQVVRQPQIVAAAPRRQQTQQYLQGTQELVQYQPVYQQQQQQAASSASHTVTTAGHINQFLAETSPEVAHYNRGAGSLVILENDNSYYLKVRKISVWTSGLLDVSWWKNNENVLVSTSCDGSIQVWKLFGSDAVNPLKIFKEHSLDVSSVDSNHNLIASSSWDSTIKIWDVNSISSVVTLKETEGIVHCVKWSDAFPNLLLSVSSDYHLILWDKSQPLSSIHKVKSQNSESLGCNWNTFNPYEVGICGSDGLIKIWDIRCLKCPTVILEGHKKAIAKIKWSPHHSGVIGSASYDLSTGIWDANQRKLLETIHHHSGFIFGFDFNPHIPGQVADCALDSLVHIFTPTSLHALNYKKFFKSKL